MAAQNVHDKENIDDRSKIFCKYSFPTLGLIERGDLPSKNGEYGIRRIAGFKLGSKRMGGDVFPG